MMVIELSLPQPLQHSPFPVFITPTLHELSIQSMNRMNGSTLGNAVFGFSDYRPDQERC